MTKAAGGTDEAGQKWAPLKPETVAYGRRHPRPKLKKGQKGVGRPLLNTSQDAKWRAIYSGLLVKWRRESGASESTPEEKSHAAAMAWIVLKAAGGKTVLGEFGNAPHEILQDTGQLANSLSPGLGSTEQVLRQEPGAVIVGTNRKGAAAHHAGAPSRGLPQRRLWPKSAEFPEGWWQRLLGVTRLGVQQIIAVMVQGR